MSDQIIYSKKRYTSKDKQHVNLTSRQKKILTDDDKSARYLKKFCIRAEEKKRAIEFKIINEMNDAEFLLKNLDKINQAMDTCFTVTDVQYGCVSIQQNRILEYMYGIFKDTKLFDKIDKIHPIKKQYHKVLDPLNEEMGNFYKARLNNTNSLYRGTCTDELGSMLESGKIGSGKTNYEFVCVTCNEKVGRGFNTITNKFRTHIVIEFIKDDVQNSIASQGYDINKFGDSRQITHQQSFYFLEEEEHRLPNNKINVKDIKMKIHVKLTSHDAIEKFTEQYGSLGEIINTWNGDLS